jgi:hypothetical protein
MYVSRFISGDFEPFWPHAILLSSSVLASIAVGAGILFERPEYSSSVHKIAFWLIVVGIAVEAVCTIFLFVFDEGISSAQQSKIISLENRLAGRSLTAEQQEALKRRMTPFAKQRVSIGVLPMLKEHADFGLQLLAVLKASGVDAEINQPAAELSIGAADGIVARYITGNKKGQAFAEALADELYKAGIEAHALNDLNEASFHPPAPETNPDRNDEKFAWVVIGVGDKR